MLNYRGLAADVGVSDVTIKNWIHALEISGLIYLLLPETSIKSSKLRVFSDTVDELLANRHKVLVFSQFVGHLTILRQFPDSREMAENLLAGTDAAGKVSAEELLASRLGYLYFICYGMLPSLLELRLLFSAFLFLFSASLTSTGLMSSGIGFPNRFS